MEVCAQVGGARHRDRRGDRHAPHADPARRRAGRRPAGRGARRRLPGLRPRARSRRRRRSTRRRRGGSTPMRRPAATRCSRCCARRRSPASAGPSSSTTRWSARARSAAPARPTPPCCSSRPTAAAAPSPSPIDGNGRRVACDPYVGAVEAVLECARNLACVGAEPLGLTNCLNFGNPEKPHIAWQLTAGGARAGRRLPRARRAGRRRQRLALQRGPRGADLPDARRRHGRHAAGPGARARHGLRGRGAGGGARRAVRARAGRLGAGEAARRASPRRCRQIDLREQAHALERVREAVREAGLRCRRTTWPRAASRSRSPSAASPAGSGRGSSWASSWPARDRARDRRPGARGRGVLFGEGPGGFARHGRRSRRSPQLATSGFPGGFLTLGRIGGDPARDRGRTAARLQLPVVDLCNRLRERHPRQVLLTPHRADRRSRRTARRVRRLRRLRAGVTTSPAWPTSRLFALQHRGQESAGIATGRGRPHHDRARPRPRLAGLRRAEAARAAAGMPRSATCATRRPAPRPGRTPSRSTARTAASWRSPTTAT